MIRLTILEALEKQGKSLYWLAYRTETAYSTIHRMATKPMKKIDLEVFERVCRALDCEPGELLILSEDEARK